MDTSTDLGSVAVVQGGEVRAEIAARVSARHGETLLPIVREALAHASIAPAELDLVAVGIGPGSFTGTRIGVATAKGLVLALDRPIVGVVSLRAIARGAPGRWIVPVVDAHKGEVYLAVYERAGGALIERLAPLHAVPEEAAVRARAVLAAEEAVVCGSGVRRYPELAGALAPCVVLPAVWDAPRAAILAVEAEERLHERGPDDRAALEPLYVRPSDAKLPAPRSPGA